MALHTTKVQKDFTGYIMLNHKRCGGHTRVFVGQWFFNNYAADGKTIQIASAHRTTCNGCGASLITERGIAQYGRVVEEIDCNGRCRNAYGNSPCECACGGAMHGDNYRAA